MAETVVLDHPTIRRHYRVIESLVRSGASAREVGRQLRAGGATIANERLFAAVADIRERVRLSTALQFLNFDQVPNQRSIPLAPYRQIEPYNFLVGVNVVPGSGGQRFERYVIVTSSELVTRFEIESIAEEILERYAQAGQPGVRDFRLLGGTRAASTEE